MTASIAPRSDQINAEDLITGPCTVTITDVTRGTTEQPVDIVTVEFGPGRPYKPSKTMRRLLVIAWGTDASAYIGRRITIYRDPDITFGRDRVGGIRISHLSHIDKRLEIALAVTRGRRATFTVEPLKDAAHPNARNDAPSEPLPDEAPQPDAADEQMPPQTRRKWRGRMFQLLNEADCNDRDDQLIVIAAAAGLPVGSLEHRDGITDEQLRDVVNHLNGWNKDGILGQSITDILNSSTIANESSAQQE
jgi:hypothetical protein